MPTPTKPAALHALTGTKSQARTAAAEVDNFPAGRPQMPKDLPPLAEQEWRRLVPKLNKRRQLSKADGSAVEIYCRMYSRWRRVADLAEDEPLERVTWLDTNGNEHSKTVESAASKIATRLEASLRNFLMQLSATPAARGKTPSTTPEKKPAEMTFDEKYFSDIDNRKPRVPDLVTPDDIREIEETLGAEIKGDLS
jgi:P27 family predicted phage terminase small subunit